MTEIAHTIDLKLTERLKDRKFRQRFFVAETSAQIARQLVALRKKRQLNQKEVADLLQTRQPAISRVERADYHNWSFNTLRRLAEALDARLRVIIEPSEDILAEYDEAATRKSGSSVEDAESREFNQPRKSAADDNAARLRNYPLPPPNENSRWS